MGLPIEQLSTAIRNFALCIKDAGQSLPANEFEESLTPLSTDCSEFDEVRHAALQEAVRELGIKAGPESDFHHKGIFQALRIVRDRGEVSQIETELPHKQSELLRVLIGFEACGDLAKIISLKRKPADAPAAKRLKPLALIEEDLKLAGLYDDEIIQSGLAKARITPEDMLLEKEAYERTAETTYSKRVGQDVLIYPFEPEADLWKIISELSKKIYRLASEYES